MGLSGVDRQGLTFGELRRFNPDFQDLLGDRARMWLPGAPASHRLEVAKVLPIVTTVWGAGGSATPGDIIEPTRVNLASLARLAPSSGTGGAGAGPRATA